MSWTKRQFVIGALEELGLSSFAFDIQPEELESALRRLDAMMSEWNIKGLRLSYPTASNPAYSNINDATGVPDYANEAIITNLALRLASSYGKAVSRETKVIAKNAYNTLLTQSGTVQPIERQLPQTMPIGAGHKRFGDNNSRFMPTPSDPVNAGTDSVLEYN